MTNVEALVEIVKILVRLWYDPGDPFTSNADVHRLVRKVNKDLLGAVDSWETSQDEYLATNELIEFYKVDEP